MMKNILSIGLICLLGSLTACSTQSVSEEDVIGVRKVLAERSAAIEAKDLDRYLAVFMKDYFDGKYKLEDIRNEMQAAFERYETIELTQQKSPVDIKMNSARVIQRIVYEAKGTAKPLRGHEQLLLRRIEGEWKISGGVQLGLL